MATYTTNGGIKKIATGDESGTWGTSTNLNFDIIDRITNGVGTITLSGTTHTLTTSDGTLSDGMFRVLVLSGSPSGTNTITIAPNDAQKLYIVKNGSGQDAVFSQGSGANVTVANGNSAIIYCDGGGASAAVTDVSSDFGALAASNNLSDLASAATALTNLGITATAAELNYNDISAVGQVQASKVLTADSNSNITMTDNSKMRFGTGLDLEIYHDGTNSLIADTGTGNLVIRASNFQMTNSSGSNYMMVANDGGAAYLYYNGTNRLETTNTGVDVGGVLQAEGVTVDGPLDIEEVKEKVTPSTSTTGTLNFNLIDQAIVNLTSDQTANRTINLRGNGSTTLNSVMATDQSMTCTVIAKQGSTAYYFNAYQVDGSTVTPKWSGGSAPSAGNASSLDVYTFTIIKTADATFTVLASLTQYA